MAISLSSNSNTAVFTSNVQSPAKAGMIQPFAGTTPPNGWALCDGSVVSQTDYPDLFIQIGTTWDTAASQAGAGGFYPAPSSGFFRLPDLRGVFLRGVGTSTKANGTGSIAVNLAAFTNDSTAPNALATSSSTVTGTITMNSSAVTGTITMNSSTVTGQTLTGSAASLSATNGLVLATGAHTHNMNHVHQTLYMDTIGTWAPTSPGAANLTSFTNNVTKIYGGQLTTTGSNFCVSTDLVTRSTYSALPIDTGGSASPNTGGASASSTLSISGGSYSLSGSPTAAGQTVNTLSLNAAGQTINTSSLTAAAQNLTGSTETAPRYTGINYLIKLYNDSANLAVSTGQLIIDGNNTFSQLSVSPAAPQSGFLAMYAKNDGKFYQKTPAGTESLLGGALTSSDEGTPVSAATTTLNFTGAGVTASLASPGVVTVNVPGGGSGDINNGGNSFGSAMTIGTNDAFALNFETNNIPIATGATTGSWSIGPASYSGTHTFNGNIKLASNSTFNTGDHFRFSSALYVYSGPAGIVFGDTAGTSVTTMNTQGGWLFGTTNRRTKVSVQHSANCAAIGSPSGQAISIATSGSSTILVGGERKYCCFGTWGL